MTSPNTNTDDDTIKEALYPPPTYSVSSRAIMDQTAMLNAQSIREQVDERIFQLESEIRALKTHRNVVADTSPLPPEILSNIFITLRKLVESGYYYRSTMTWIRVTHVCRHWRAVALDCPALWSHLTFVTPAFAEMMLQRSKNAPLTIKFSGYPNRFHDILCKIASQTSRLRDVRLHSLSGEAALDLPEILSCFESTAPTLERLVLEGTIATYRFEAPSIPERFLQDGAPSLRHLEVTRFAIRWDALPLSSTLTNLRLQNVMPGTRPPRKLFLESVGNLSRLETLELSACLPSSGNVSNPGRSLPLIFPCLQTLELKDPAAEIRQFFGEIQIPKEARVDIELSDSDPDSESLGPLFSALKESWVLSQGSVIGLAQSDILELRIAGGTGRFDNQVKCWFKNHELPPSFEVDSPPANLVVSARTASRSTISISLATAIAERLDISSLRSLKIASHHIMREELLELFKNLTRLDKIAIWYIHDTLTKFLKALKKEDDTSLDAPTFPALRSIHLHGIDFDDNLMGDAEDAVRALISAIENREESHPIKRLAITQCINFSEAHWEYLCNTLSEEIELDWDEDEDMREPSDHEGEDYDYDSDFDFYQIGWDGDYW